MAKETNKNLPPIVVVPAGDALVAPFAFQFVKSGNVVLLVRQSHAEADAVELRARMDLNDFQPVAGFFNGAPFGQETELTVEPFPDRPFRILAIGKGKEDAAPK